MSEKSLTVLVISYVWPEPTSSAAGMRTFQVVEALQARGWKVFMSSPSRTNDFTQALERRGVECVCFEANDSNFDPFLKSLAPDVVIFDRFVIEEQFSWRVREHAPQAVRILDTQDLHFLRRTRQAALDRGVELESVYRGELDFQGPDTLRELASIFRSDFTWVLSEFEAELLVNKFGVSRDCVGVSRFAYPQPASFLDAAFEGRYGFVWVGNFRHPPNRDGIIWLKHEIWPLIRQMLPQAELNIYGAYPPKDLMRFDDPGSGFRVRGWARDIFAILSQARVSLAPLRFGAGIKGKISDSWAVGTPVVTTPIGSEGMNGEMEFGGSVERDPHSIAKSAVKLHQDDQTWLEASERGSKIIRVRFKQDQVFGVISENVLQRVLNLDEIRNRNWTGAILWHQTMRSTEYFSRWIEEKNRQPIQVTST